MRKEREAQNTEWKAAYFEECDEKGEKYYKYIRDYWKDREKGEWSHMAHIFEE